MVRAELLHLPQCRRLCRGVEATSSALLRVVGYSRRRRRRGKAVDLLELLKAEATGLAVIRSDFVHDCNRLLVAPVPHQILRALVEVEAEVAQDPHDEHDPAHREEEVAPSLVLGARAARRGGGLRAGEVGD